MYCTYFQAHVPPSSCFLVIGMLKSFEHMAFARTLDVQKGVVEFFVPAQATPFFIELAKLLEKHSLIFDLVELPNRLAECAKK
jgi:hypothetical protein